MRNVACTIVVSLREGDYLTDQRRLYRVLQVLPSPSTERAAILEDCRTLETAVYPAAQLASMRLRTVRPATT